MKIEHSGANIEITKGATGHIAWIYKNGDREVLVRATQEQAEKSAKFFAERMW